jgi:HEAT repeat protein
MTDVDTQVCSHEVMSSEALQAKLNSAVAALGSPNQVDRIHATRVLGRYGSDKEVPLLATALNDRIEYVAAEAAQGLASINSDMAFSVLCRHFEADLIERPQYLSHAIAQFGDRGLKALLSYARSTSATLRCFACRGLGETRAAAALPVLQEIAATDSAVTPFGALVSTGAKAGLRTWHKLSSGCQREQA